MGLRQVRERETSEAKLGVKSCRVAGNSLLSLMRKLLRASLPSYEATYFGMSSNGTFSGSHESETGKARRVQANVLVVDFTPPLVVNFDDDPMHLVLVDLLYNSDAPNIFCVQHINFLFDFD